MKSTSKKKQFDSAPKSERRVSDKKYIHCMETWLDRITEDLMSALQDEEEPHGAKLEELTRVIKDNRSALAQHMRKGLMPKRLAENPVFDQERARKIAERLERARCSATDLSWEDLLAVARPREVSNVATVIRYLRGNRTPLNDATIDMLIEKILSGSISKDEKYNELGDELALVLRDALPSYDHLRSLSVRMLRALIDAIGAGSRGRSVLVVAHALLRIDMTHHAHSSIPAEASRRTVSALVDSIKSEQGEETIRSVVLLAYLGNLGIQRKMARMAVMEAFHCQKVPFELSANIAVSMLL